MRRKKKQLPKIKKQPPKIKKHHQIKNKNESANNLSGFEPKLIKLEFIIYLPKLKVSTSDWQNYKNILKGVVSKIFQK